jgi:hypothetical protein
MGARCYHYTVGQPSDRVPSDSFSAAIRLCSQSIHVCTLGRCPVLEVCNQNIEFSRAGFFF